MCDPHRFKLPVVSFALVAPLIICLCTFPSKAAGENRAQRAILRDEGDFSCLSAKEFAIFQLVNQYRESSGLPSIPNSRALTRVARLHAMDLVENHPEAGRDRRGVECNLHSWSVKGPWTPVCYTGDHFYSDLMRNKPAELTPYFFPGYENVYWTSGREVVPMRAVENWKASAQHRALILETGDWKGINLMALGVGVYKNVAVIWVGAESDALGGLPSCSSGKP